MELAADNSMTSDHAASMDDSSEKLPAEQLTAYVASDPIFYFLLLRHVFSCVYNILKIMFNISLAKASMNCLFIRVAPTEVCCRVVLPLELTLFVHRTSSCRRRSAKERVEKYKCNICSYRSKWSHGLSNHMRRHNNTLFKCAECDYSTPWKGDLTNHMRLHSGEFIFQLKGLLVNMLRV